MPKKLPLKARVKVVRQHKPCRSIDWLVLWAISLGVSALVIASIAYFSDGDQISSALILAGTAILMAKTLLVERHGKRLANSPGEVVSDDGGPVRVRRILVPYTGWRLILAARRDTGNRAHGSSSGLHH